MHRVLQPGGKLITTCMAKPWEDYLLLGRIFGDGFKKWFRKVQVHINLLSRDEWIEQFTKAGFTVRTEVGYITPACTVRSELCHFLAVPNLLLYKLFGQWTIFKGKSLWSGLTESAARVDHKAINFPANQAGAIFYILEKPITK